MSLGMSILVRAFATYMFCSMTSGLVYFATMTLGFVSVREFNMSLFVALWLGPPMAAIAIGAPVLFLHVWKSARPSTDS